MALLGSFELIGFSDEISISTPWCDVSNEYDPSDILIDCSESFEEASKSICPVDTGLLVSSILAEADNETIMAIADTDYAQYVEYGTWKMVAQPYFENEFYSMAERAKQNCLSYYGSIIVRTNAMADGEIWRTYEELKAEAYEEYRDEIETILSSPGSSEEKGAEMGQAWAEYKARREELRMMRDEYIADALVQSVNYYNSVDFNYSVEID